MSRVASYSSMEAHGYLARVQAVKGPHLNNSWAFQHQEAGVGEVIWEGWTPDADEARQRM